MQTKEKKKKISLFSWIFLSINGIAIFLLLAVYLSAFINPEKFVWLAFFGLAYPIILLVNLLFILFWLLVRIKFAFFSLLAIIIGWNFIGGLIQFVGKDEPADAKGSIKILSYNIQNFLKQNISTTKYIKNFENQSKVTRYVMDQGADIICLQEMLYDRGNHRDFAVDFGKKCRTPNFYYRNYFQGKKKTLEAIAIFTRFPIINTGYLEHNAKTICVFTDIVTGKDTVRIYNLHLASIHFRQEDYDFIEEIQKQNEPDNLAAGSQKVLSKLQAAFIRRGEQSVILERHFKKCPYPYMICGDFNDTPSSYVYRTLSAGLKDAFVESGAGTGSTFADKSFPALRIDYILHSEKFAGYGFKREKIDLSDHYPVSCVLLRDGK